MQQLYQHHNNIINDRNNISKMLNNNIRTKFYNNTDTKMCDDIHDNIRNVIIININLHSKLSNVND